MTANQQPRPTGGGRPRRRMAPEERREHLIGVALRLFSEHPPERITPEDVAEAADVSRALVYRYFPNIRELHTASLRSAIDELLPQLTPPDDLPLLDQLRRALGNFMDFADTYAPAYVALLSSGSVVATSETDALIDEVRNHVVNLVLARAEADRTPFMTLTLRCWVATAEATILIWLQERALPREELQAWLIDQLVAMASTTATRDSDLEALVRRMAT